MNQNLFIEMPIKTEKSYLAIYDLPESIIIDNCVGEINGKLLKNPPIIVCGKPAHQHRSIGFFSVTDEKNEPVLEGYKYSGQLAKSQPITPNLLKLLEYVNSQFGTKYNGILVNKYENGEDSIGDHSDDEKFLDPVGVACISWGEIRKFRIRDKKTKTIIKDIPTIANKIMLMGGDFQKEFTHGIPVEKKKTNARISFTFRSHKIDIKQPAIQTEDYIGRYCGDIYGCGFTGLKNDQCNLCVKCNPKLYWLKRRNPPRPDMLE